MKHPLQDAAPHLDDKEHQPLVDVKLGVGRLLVHQQRHKEENTQVGHPGQALGLIDIGRGKLLIHSGIPPFLTVVAPGTGAKILSPV